MIKAGLFSVEKQDGTFIFRKTEIANSQFVDTMEFSHLFKLENQIKSAKVKYYAGWSIIDRENLVENIFNPGNFLSLENVDFSAYLIPEIELTMSPLIHEWDSGHGIMMGYESTLEIDNHFLANATQLVLSWRDDAGLHPETEIGGIKGSELIAVVILIVSFHLKHIQYATIASKKNPKISIPQSLTIWAPLDELILDIAEFSSMNKEVVSKAFEMIMFKADDVTLLQRHTTKFMPLIIDIGNGFILRPVSSILENPFFTVIAMLEHRDHSIRNAISYPREEWLRSHLNALFAGSRYQNIEGNIRLREGNAVVTDIDAALYDNLTGELALFQIKWQDFFYNDVKKLRSKSSNLTKELDEWAYKISNWVKVNGVNRLVKNLGIRLTKQITPSDVYLFAISRNMARVHGYGFK